MSDRATTIILAMYFMGNPPKKRTNSSVLHGSRRRGFWIGGNRASTRRRRRITGGDRSPHDGTIAVVLWCPGADSAAGTRRRNASSRMIGTAILCGGVRAAAIMTRVGLNGSCRPHEHNQDQKCQAPHEIQFDADAAGVTRQIVGPTGAACPRTQTAAGLGRARHQRNRSDARAERDKDVKRVAMFLVAQTSHPKLGLPS